MSAIAARKAALLLQQAAHALPVHTAPKAVPSETTPHDVPQASSSRKTYSKKDNASKGNKGQKNKNPKKVESSRTSRRQSPVQPPIEIPDEPENRLEDRVFVEIDVVDAHSAQETEEGSEQEVQTHADAPPEASRAPSADVSDGSDFDFDFEESGILSANGRPRKKRRIDTDGQAVSKFVPVEGVNVHGLSADAIEHILPNLPKRRGVLVVLNIDEVSYNGFKPKIFAEVFSDYRPERSCSNYSHSRQAFIVLLNNFPVENASLLFGLRSFDTPATNVIALGCRTRHPPSSPPLSTPYEYSNHRSNSDRLPHPRPHHGSFRDAGRSRGPAQSIPGRSRRIRSPRRPPHLPIHVEPHLPLYYSAIMARSTRAYGTVIC